jgi:putative ABC transport system permease protein
MRWLRHIFRSRQINADLSAELRAHLDEKIDALIACGLPRHEAEFSARRQFGNSTQLEEHGREVWRWPTLESFFSDIRFAFRMLRKNPGFTAVATLTLALGIGATTAIFSVVNAVMLRPLPYPEPQRILQLSQTLQGGESMNAFTVAQFRYLRDGNAGIFSAIAGYRGNGTVTLNYGKQMDWANSIAVTDGFFRVLGVNPELGREILPSETQPGSSRSVLLSNALWLRTFGSDPDVIGRQVLLDNRPYTIAGVLPPEFRFVEQPADLFVSLPLGNNAGDRGTNTEIIARLNPGANVNGAHEQLTAIYAQMPDRGNAISLDVASYQIVMVGDVRKDLLVLSGAVGLLLVIACANVASLFLARANARTKEMSVRLAIGAGRARLLRQFLTESFVMALIGSGVGLIAAVWAARALGASIPWDLPNGMKSISIDANVLIFALSAAVVTSVVFGLAAFWQATRCDIGETLKQGGHGYGGAASSRVRNILVIGQLAISVTLLVGAALLGRTLYNLRSEKLGFDPKNLLMVSVPMPRQFPPIQARSMLYEQKTLSLPNMSSSQTWARRWVYEQDLLMKIGALPGVVSAAIVNVAPLSGQGNFPTQAAGLNDPAHSIGGTEIRVVSAGYFDTMKIPVVAGHRFTGADAAVATPVVIINETLEKRWWPGRSALGEHIQFASYLGKSLMNPPDTPREIIGIVGDVKGRALTRPAPPMLYIPAPQDPGVMNAATVQLMVRTASKANLSDSIRQTAGAMNPDQRAVNIRAMNDVVSTTIRGQSFNALLIGLFASVALALASVGIYGVLNLHVLQRTREIGIRVALGATPGQLLRMVLGQGFALAAIGVVIGALAALGLTRFLKSMLYNVSATSTFSFVVGAALVIGVTLLASYVPARRAMKLDPIIALRHE